MSNRTRYTIITAALALVALVLASTATIALGGPPTQIDPTQQQQTIDAIIAERFTQTAAVQMEGDLTLTAVVAEEFGPTLTAQFEQTVEAAFEQALTATAGPQATATAASVQQVNDQVLAWEGHIADDVTLQLAASLQLATQNVQSSLDAGSNTYLALLRTAPDAAEFADQQAAANALLAEAAGAQPGVINFWLYDSAGTIVAASSADFTGASIADQPYFAPSLTEAGAHAVLYDAGTQTHAVLLTVPVTNGSTTALGALAAVIDANMIGEAITLANVDPNQPVSVYIVNSAGILIAPDELSGQDVTLPLASEGITLGLSGQSGSGSYDDYQGQRVVGVVRYLPDLNIVLLVEVPQDVVQTVAANIPQPTATPTATPQPTAASATPRPEVFPTDTFAEVDIAEAVFEHGRMFWIRHTRQIWVMIDDPDPAIPGGDWYCYNDTFEEGEPEIDPDLIPPEGMFQPRRGFGKLWRANPEFQDRMGWALTPEFELTSRYTYIAGGYVDSNGVYIPGPGEHRLTTLDEWSISFFEREIRGDCLGGLWRQTGQ
jgi:hypothetical protein